MESYINIRGWDDNYDNKSMELLDIWNDNEIEKFKYHYLFSAHIIDELCYHYSFNIVNKEEFNESLEKEFIECVIDKIKNDSEKLTIIKTMKNHGMNYKEWLC